MTTDHFEARIAELHAADERNKLVETCATELAKAVRRDSEAFDPFNDAPSMQAVRDDYRTQARTVLEASGYDQLSDDRDFHAKRCLDVETVLDRALGTDGEDGTGEGIAADVALVVRQRDEARAELANALAALPLRTCRTCGRERSTAHVVELESGEWMCAYGMCPESAPTAAS